MTILGRAGPRERVSEVVDSVAVEMGVFGWCKGGVSIRRV